MIIHFEGGDPVFSSRWNLLQEGSHSSMSEMFWFYEHV
jgi:hypothetical protein